jgi:hypothetical protein
MLDQLGDVVERQPWSKTKIASDGLEGLLRRGCLARGESTPQGFIHDILEGPAGTARFRLEPRRA